MKRLTLFVLTALLCVAPLSSVRADSSIQENAQQVISIGCGWVIDDEYYTVSWGSGVALGESMVLTNAHVGLYDAGEVDLYEYDYCIGGTARNMYSEPAYDMVLVPTVYNNENGFDYVVMAAYDTDIKPYTFASEATYGNADSLVLGDDLTLLGYPAIADGTILATTGVVSGYSGDQYIRSDAIVEFGNSGGAAFDARGNLVGLVTSVSVGELNSLTNIQNLNAIFEDFVPEAITRDYDTLYTIDNYTCFTDDACYNFGEGDDIPLDGLNDEEAVVPEATPLTDAEALAILESEQLSNEDAAPVEGSGTVFTDTSPGAYDEAKRSLSMRDNVKGQILLQVELRGEAWYVNPGDGLRYYMKDDATAYEMMRFFGLGITDEDLSTIPLKSDTTAINDATSICSQNALARSLRGRILLQVEQHGEAWYVDPDTCYRIYMADGDAAYTIMRYLGLGITDADLERLPWNLETPTEVTV